MKAIDNLFKYDILDSARITLRNTFPNLKNSTRKWDVRLLKQGCPECIKGTAGHNVCHLVYLYQIRYEGESEWKDAPIKNTCLACENWIMGREGYILQQYRKVEKKTRDYWRIPADLEDATLDNYATDDPATAQALMISKQYLENWDEGKRQNLIFRGSYGAGKSHLLKAIASEIKKKIKADDEPFLVGFIPMETVLTMIKKSYDDKTAKSESQIIQELIDLDFLVLDDIGTEGGEWAGRRLFEIINGRIGKATAISTNITDWDEFDKRFDINGGKIRSRLRKKAKEFDIDTTDKRLEDDDE